MRPVDQNPSQKPSRSCGFTLVELMIVVAVIAVLLSLLLPSFRRAREDARRTVCLANLKHIGLALVSYANDHRDFGPQVMAPIGNRAPRSLLSRPSILVNLGLLWPSALADPGCFTCPSQQQFQYPAELDKLESDLVAGSYAYAVHVPATESPRIGSIRHLALASDDFTSHYGEPGIGRYAHRTLYNVLYTDGSAAAYPDPDESIWKRRVYWDDESDAYTYSSFYDAVGRVTGEDPSKAYGADIFQVWYAFCYSRPDPF